MNAAYLIYNPANIIFYYKSGGVATSTTYAYFGASVFTDDRLLGCRASTTRKSNAARARSAHAARRSLLPTADAIYLAIGLLHEATKAFILLVQLRDRARTTTVRKRD